ncbi:MAG: aldo/keto reductase [Deltaproteobacteria bacterium]|nr:MAG: aldo/keto reductase [Deltaproteobacteria bacterium]PIE74712.1 MAG: aldo/keto reductase [Deltaproteobacteria bacterium]
MKLGKTTIEISKIIMGTWQAGKHMWTGINDAESTKAIETAYNQGITTFDTAEMYGKGHSERILGQALKNIRKKIVLATKAAPHNLSRQKLINSCEKSLKNLETDYIDLYQIHWPSGSFGSKKIPVEETLEAMNELKKQGKIRAIGVSNFSKDQLKEAMKTSTIDSIQPPYSILWRHIEKDLLPFCQKNNISILSYSSLGQGLLTGKFNKNHKFEKGDNRRSNKLFSNEILDKAIDVIDKIRPIALELGISLTTLSLSWITSRDGLAAIAGARNALQAGENAKASGFKLDKDIIEKINEASLDLQQYLGESPVMWQ